MGMKAFAGLEIFFAAPRTGVRGTHFYGTCFLYGKEYATGGVMGGSR
jgi:hypothetical protein